MGFSRSPLRWFTAHVRALLGWIREHGGALLHHWAEVGQEPAPRSWWVTIMAVCLLAVAGFGAAVTQNINNGHRLDAQQQTLRTEQRNLMKQQHRLKVDEYQTCQIQVRGIKANNELRGFVGSVGEALSLVPAQTQIHARHRHHLTRFQRRELHLLLRMRSSAKAYAQTQSKQPKKHKCVKP